MQPFPHLYSTTAAGTPDGPIRVTSPGLPDLETAAPAEFDGPGDRWSPESLLVAAVADCYVLTFRAIARGSQLAWTRLECDTEARLERIERVTRFTEITVHARLEIPEGTNRERAQRLLEKAEQTCLVTNSMTSEIRLESEIVSAETAVGEPVA